MYLIHSNHGIVKFQRVINDKWICNKGGIIIIAAANELTKIDYTISQKEISRIIKEQVIDPNVLWSTQRKNCQQLLNSIDVRDWAKVVGLIRGKDLNFGERKLLNQAKEKIQLYLDLQKTEVDCYDAV